MATKSNVARIPAKPRQLTADDPMEVTVDELNGRITINAPVSGPTVSASGKSVVVATTRGNLLTDAEYDGNQLTVGLNVYYRR